ncbi:hypothetical protein XENTR_v10007998 [Xenopus tropicalis]|nr:hypothetical protein XENTR_v10007998 [Xenopus tropicalis]
MGKIRSSLLMAENMNSVPSILSIILLCINIKHEALSSDNAFLSSCLLITFTMCEMTFFIILSLVFTWTFWLVDFILHSTSDTLTIETRKNVPR